MTTSEQNGNVMPSIPAHYEGKQDFKWTSTKYTLSLYYHQSHNQTKLALYDSEI